MELNEPKTIKRLPRAQNGKFKNLFPANGTTYRILEVDQLSAAKWNIFRRYSAFALSGVRADSAFRVIKETRAALDAFTRDKASLGGAYATLDTHEKGLTELSDDKKDAVFSAAACFIIPEGGNEVDFIPSVAERSIEDWEKEGYTHADFFFLFLQYLAAYNQYLSSDSQTVLEGLTTTVD